MNIPLLIGTVAVMVLTLLLWPAGALVRRHYGRKLELTKRRRIFRLLARLVPALDLLFMLAFNATISVATSVSGAGAGRLDVWLRILQAFAGLGVLGALVPLRNAIGAWLWKDRWLLARLGDTALALACLGFVWLVFVMNLLSPSLSF